MKCVKVPLKKLNDTRRSLMEKNLMNMNYKIKTKNEYGFIAINKNIDGYEIVDIDLDKIKRHPKNITELLKDELSAEEIEDLKT